MENERPLKIAFMGGPGVGKTTLLNHFREREDATVVDEAARDYFTLYPDVDRTSVETQSLLLQHVIEREEAAIAFGKPLTVCDRAIVDPIAYMHHYGFSNEARELFQGIAQHVSTYDRLYLLDPTGVPYETDEVRNETAEERMQIHEAFLHVLEAQGIEYHLLSGEKDERIMTIDQHVQLFRA